MHSTRATRTKLLLLGLVLTASGCANLRLPAIDPSGGRLFLPSPNYTTLARDGFLSRLHGGPRFGSRPGVGVPPGTATPVPLPGPYDPALPNRQRGPGMLQRTGDALRRMHDRRHRFFDNLSQRGLFPNNQRTPATLFGNSAYPRTPLPPDCGPNGQPPANGPCYPIGSPSASSLNPNLLRGGNGTSLGLGGGCGNRFSRIGPVVILSQPRYTARVGQEVVVLGAIAARSGIQRGGEPVQWSLSNDSVGTIIDAARPTAARPRLLGFLHPASARTRDCGTSVRSITSDRCRVVTRSPGNPADDVYLSKGQTWVSLTSGSPGRSFITLSAPQLGYGNRAATAIIDWTDATWECPAPVLASLEVGQLITKVYRNASRDPIPNWNVRYTYIDGPKVNFDNGSQDAIDVSTDAKGRAILTVRPSGTEPGTTRFAIQIFDPSVPAQPVHQGIGYITWSESVPVGGELEYPEEPTSVGPPYLGDDAPEIEAEPFTPNDDTPPSYAAPFESTTPPATTPPIIAQPSQPSPQPPAQPPAQPERTRLSINVTPPQDVILGGRARFVIDVVNNGNVSATEVTVDSEEPMRGLRLIQRSQADPFRQGSVFFWDLGSIPPGGRVRRMVDFEVEELNPPTLNFTAGATNAVNDVTSGPIAVRVIPRNLVKPAISQPSPFSPEVGQGVAYNVAIDNLIRRRLPVRLVIRDWSDGLRPVVKQGTPSSQAGIQYPEAPFPPVEIPPGGRSQPLALPFETLRPGPQQFTVVAIVEDPTIPNAEPVSEQVFINVRPATVQPPAPQDNRSPLVINQPEDITEGDRKEVRITVTNVTQTTLTNVLVTYRGDQDLYPTADSTRPIRISNDGRSFEWSFREMQPGESGVIVVMVEARNNPARSEGVNEILLVSDQFQLGREGDAAPIPEIVRIPIIPRVNQRDAETRRVGIQSRGPELRSRRPDLPSRRPNSMTLQATVDTAPRSLIAGEPFEIVIRLDNRNPRSFREVSVLLNLPPDAKLLDYRGPPTAGARVSADGRHLHFGTLQEILPREKLVMRAQVTAANTGHANTVTRIEAIGLRDPIIINTELEVH